MADLLDRMAAGLNDGPVNDSARAWLDRARALGNEIRRVDEALQQAEESTKLNPRSVRLPYTTVTLRQSLETLEHSAITVRILARSLVDTTRLAGDDNPVNDPDVRRGLAATLRELSAALCGAWPFPSRITSCRPASSRGCMTDGGGAAAPSSSCVS